jgi:hypothetical protein
MFRTITTKPYIVQPAISPFRWGQDFNHWIPWMLHYPLRPHMQNCPILKPNPTNPPRSLKKSSTSTNRFGIFFRSPIPSISNDMINIGFHTSFRWEINYGCICRKKALHDPIGSFVHSIMNLTSSPRLWVTIILSSTFPPSLACTQCLMWTSFSHTFHHYWTP